jgi:UDP-N-acetylmuramoyl-tripeptide--D-alanyl-D-alanine ligase
MGVELELTVAEMLKLLEVEAVGLPAADLQKLVCIELDSRQCNDKDIFWAIRGERLDGHEYVASAMEKGTLMAVVDNQWVKEKGQAVKAYVPVKDTLEGMQKLAKAYAQRFNIPKIGITGSNGKTTTKEMIFQVLSSRRKGMATNGNYNNHIGVPLTLFRLRNEHEFAVVEMGTSSPGEIKALSKMAEPNISVITNIGYSHLEGLKNLEEVYKEKSTITQGMNKGGVLIVNADDPYLCKMRSTKNYKLVTFGFKRGMIKPAELKWNADGCASFRIGRTRFDLKIPGVHNLYNALAAIAVGVQLKVPKNEISTSLAHFEGSRWRMEIREQNGLRVLADCYNANPSSMRAALNTLETMEVSGRKVAVLGDMLELGDQSQNLHTDLGKMLTELNIDLLCTVGELSEDIGKAALNNGWPVENWQHFSDTELAGDYLQGELVSGDACLLKGSRGIRLEKVLDQLASTMGETK